MRTHFASAATLTAITVAVGMGTATHALPATSALVHGDQRWIAYQSNRDGSEAVWLIHPDGTGDHRIAQGVNDEQVLPDWSPDAGAWCSPPRRRPRAVVRTLALFDGDVPSDCGIWLGKDVARLKSSADLVKAIESAVRFYEEPPPNGMRVDRCVAMTRATQRLVILTSA